MADTRGAVRFVGAGGLDLVGDAFGDPAAPPVVLLHGGGQTRYAWGGTAEAIARDGWYALALDLRGHGDSGWAPDGDYSIDAFVADLRAVAAACARPPIVVGASLGGITGLVLAGESPDPVAAALVLVDVASRIEPDGSARIREFMCANPDGFASLDEAADAIATYLPHRPRPRDTSGLAKNLRRHPDGRWRWHWDPRFIGGGRPPADAANWTRLDDAARRLAIPTLLVRGRLSDIVSEEGARHFLALVPHAVYADVSDAGHMVAGDRNDVFSDAVLGFLRSLERPIAASRA